MERHFDTTPEKIWKAITDSNEMKKWYFDLPCFKAEVGYEFSFEGGPPEHTYLHLCKVTEMIPGKKLTYSWRYDGYEGISFVTFELFGEGKKTKLKLTHRGLDTFAVNNNPHFDAKNFEAGWNSIVETSLKNYLGENN